MTLRCGLDMSLLPCDLDGCILEVQRIQHHELDCLLLVCMAKADYLLGFICFHEGSQVTFTL